jgi:hypothetical protein
MLVKRFHLCLLKVTDTRHNSQIAMLSQKHLMTPYRFEGFCLNFLMSRFSFFTATSVCNRSAGISNGSSLDILEDNIADMLISFFSRVLFDTIIHLDS